MPQLLGMEPSKYKPLLLVGGGAVVLYFIVKSRQGASVAAEAPSGGPVAGINSPAIQPELSATGNTVSALQQQMQGQQQQFDIAAQNLALKGQEQQLQFQGRQQNFELSREQTMAAQQDAITHEQFKQLKQKGQTGGFLGALARTFGMFTGAAQSFTGTVNAASGAEQAIANFGVPQPRQTVLPQPITRNQFNSPPGTFNGTPINYGQ